MDVGVVEGRIDLVENAEGARPEIEDREEERQSGQRALATREQRHGLQALAAGLGHQLDAGVERIAALLSLDEPELGPAALEEALEELLEVPVDLLEGLRESLLCAPCHATQRLLEILDRADEVVVLRLKEPETLVELTVLVVGDEVHGPDRRQLLLELGDPRPHRLEVAGRAGRSARCAWRARAWSMRVPRSRSMSSIRVSSRRSASTRSVVDARATRHAVVSATSSVSRAWAVSIASRSRVIRASCAVSASRRRPIRCSS